MRLPTQSRSSLLRQSRRAGAVAGLCAVMAVVGVRGTQDVVANGDTRTLSLSHMHTDETLTVTFKRNGRYDEDALKQLNWMLRDWRRDEPTKMDPHLFDLVWEVHRDVGSKQPIRIVSGYRSPSTNSMLRSRGRGVAKFSQHMLGKAMDFYIPDAEIDSIREIGVRMQRGGVGWYPSSGSPFVHLDTGSVRHWPRMSRDHLARLFPDGKTVHLPADGKPLSGYDVAAREIETRGGSVRGRTQLASRADPDGDDIEYTDDGRAVSRAGSGSDTPPAGRRSLFAWLTGDRAEERPRAPAPAEAEKPAPMVAQASLTAPAPAPGTAVPMPAPRPVAEASVPVPPARPIAEAVVAAAPLAVRPNEIAINVAQGSAPGAFAEPPRVAIAPPQPAQGFALASASSVPAGPPAPTMRWVVGPQGQTSGASAPPQPPVADQAAQRVRPGAAAEPAGGFALASVPRGTQAAAPTSRQIAEAHELTASVTRQLPPVMREGIEEKPQVLAYAVPGDNSIPRGSLAAPPPAPVAQPRPAAPSSTREAMLRDPGFRLLAPRVEGPGLPRVITTIRMGEARMDFRHPDYKAATPLLRTARGAVDMHFAPVAYGDMTHDRFTGPAIKPLPVARFEVASR